MKEPEFKIGDSFSNWVSGLGTSNDPLTAGGFAKNRKLQYDREELEALYMGNDLAGRIAEIKPDDSTREWRKFIGDIDSDIIEQLEELERELDIRDKFRLADIWGNVYGTGMLLLAVDDGKDPSEPLEIDTLKPDCLRYIQVMSRDDCTYNEIVDRDPFSPNFNKPLVYSFNETNQRIHHTRIIRFEGVTLPQRDLEQNAYWSNSIYIRLFEIFRNLETVTTLTASMALQADTTVVSIPNLQEHFTNPIAAENLMTRYQTLSYLKSTHGILLKDDKEEISQLTNSLTSVSEIQDKMLVRLAAATDIPQTRLLGASPTGLNATGKGDEKNYIATIKARQKRQYDKPLYMLDQIMAKHLGLSDDIDLSYKWNNLFDQSAEEIAALQNANADRDLKYLNAGVINEVDVMCELMEDKVYSSIDQERIDEMEEVLENMEAEELLSGEDQSENQNSNAQGE